MKRLLLLAVLFSPLAALAQAVDPVAPTLAASLEELIIAVVLAIIGFFWRRAALSKDRQQLVFVAADIAYGLVNEVARRTSNKIDDKVALGLAEVTKFLRAQGSSATLSPAEEATVKAVFSAKHGNEAKALEALKARPQTPLAAS